MGKHWCKKCKDVGVHKAKPYEIMRKQEGFLKQHRNFDLVLPVIYLIKPKPISMKTFVRYMELAAEKVTESIILECSKIKRFGMLFDRWYDGHLVATFVAFMKENSVKVILLSCHPMDVRTKRDRFAHIDYFKSTGVINEVTLDESETAAVQKYQIDPSLIISDESSTNNNMTDIRIIQKADHEVKRQNCVMRFTYPHLMSLFFIYFLSRILQRLFPSQTPKNVFDLLSQGTGALKNMCLSVQSHSLSSTKRYLFGNPSDPKNTPAKKDGGMFGGMGNLMEQMKKAQEIAKQAEVVQKELSETIVTGADPSGLVQISYTGTAEPVGVRISEGAVALGAEALSLATTQALQDAFTKSKGLMMNKMTQLYGGLMPPQK